MDVSKLKLDVYDIFGVIIPGLLVICEIWIALRGWTPFIVGLSALSATGITMLVFASFAVGPLVQEIADSLIKAWTKNSRFFKLRRDQIWNSPLGPEIRRKLEIETGISPTGADVAFDMCFALMPDQAARHDLFLAQSAMARSLLFVSFFSALPMGINIAHFPSALSVRIGMAFAFCLIVGLIARVCWTRMLRFRALSQAAIFHGYLAHKPTAQASQAANV